ncbi:type I secretion system permease/ATPase [Tardiphaga sp. 804_B3_N1_9]|uniref:type I secretion system permease/ATPase n=1 Tax=Tardiphaga TaxID=1395974 RepID=UPI001586D878|nr:type I secretion system permease/ATPase [Tardiphaga robiniae]NUU44712.1 type I secretion system permease/ATPase [Tardiphaga robiniae]
MQRGLSRTSSLPARTELGDALRACRGAFLGVGLMSCMINILYLTGSFFMLEVYDRVLPSRSVPTLVGLIVLAGGLYVAQGILDLLRGRILVRIGSSLDEALSPRVFQTVVRLPLLAGGHNEGLQPLRDLDNVRSFLSGMGPSALFDLPWLPLYLAICFAFHPMIGVTALVGAILLVGLTILTEIMTREPAREANGLAARRSGIASASRRNAEVVVAMGMAGRLTQRWREANETYLAGNQRTSDVAGGLGAIAKVMRMILQSAVLGVGAYLVINQEATAGIIIAGSILSARALAPVDLAIAHWKGFVTARQSWHRLNGLLYALPDQAAVTQLQNPSQKLTIEGVSIAPPGEQKITVSDITFALAAGNGLGIIGPSGSGKSSLLRALVGVWKPVRGHVRLDAAALDQWAPDDLGRHIGYLPQDVELFAGSIADNICRFDPDAKDDDIITAARQAGVHDLIVGMREGYDTQVGDHGGVLSAGQAQRIALARALYGDPFLIVLDEPNSNLDTEGDEALTKAVRAARTRGAIVIVVAHRPIGIEGVDMLLVLKDGRMQAFGPKETVLGQVLQRPAAQPIKIVADGGVAKP